MSWQSLPCVQERFLQADTVLTTWLESIKISKKLYRCRRLCW